MSARVPGRNRAVLGGSVAVLVVTGLLFVLAGCGAGSSGAETGVPIATVAGSSIDQGTLLDTITVTGTGKVSTLPDEAVIQIGVETTAQTAAAALDTNSKQTQKVLEGLKAAGVPDAAIETTTVTVYPDRSYDEKTGKEKTIGYKAMNMVSVTLTDFGVIGEVYAAATEAGANNIYGPNWQLSENSQAVTQALARAAENARIKAEALAAAQGVKAGDVLILNESSSTFPYYDVARTAGEDASVTPPPVIPQSIDVTATVSATYRLER